MCSDKSRRDSSSIAHVFSGEHANQLFILKCSAQMNNLYLKKNTFKVKPEMDEGEHPYL